MAGIAGVRRSAGRPARRAWVRGWAAFNGRLLYHWMCLERRARTIEREQVQDEDEDEDDDDRRRGDALEVLLRPRAPSWKTWIGRTV